MWVFYDPKYKPSFVLNQNPLWVNPNTPPIPKGKLNMPRATRPTGSTGSTIIEEPYKRELDALTSILEGIYYRRPDTNISNDTTLY